MALFRPLSGRAPPRARASGAGRLAPWEESVSLTPLLGAARRRLRGGAAPQARVALLP